MIRNKFLILTALVLVAGFLIYSKVVRIPRKLVLIQQGSSIKESVLSTKNIGVNNLAESPWPVFQADVKRSGRSVYEGLDNLKKSGSFKSSSVVIGVDGALYFGVHDSSFES
jgi:hypothetical protein